VAFGAGGGGIIDRMAISAGCMIGRIKSIILLELRGMNKIQGFLLT
jgi:hypothetical protein